MPQVIKSVYDYLLEQKKDIYVLKFVCQSKFNRSLFFDKDNPANKETQKEILTWFKENNIDVYEAYMDKGLISGWDGTYYIDFQSKEQVNLYASKFEDSNGKSLQPTYRDWETDRKSTRLNSSHRL